MVNKANHSSYYLDTAAVALHELHRALVAAGVTVATAESCTGGLLATYLTEMPGSSAYFMGGVAAYANAAKISLLGVRPELIHQYGAVSREVAEAMAQGVRRCLGSQFGISLTGIAGPTGGSIDKPIGTVYCGLAGPHGVESWRWELAGSRGDIRGQAAIGALSQLLAATPAFK